MTPKISLITAVVGTALVLGVPAWGQSQSDALERAVLARELSQRASVQVASPDAFERAVLSQQRSAVSTYVDAPGRGSAIGDLRRSSAVSTYRDAFERAVLSGRTAGFPTDSHDRIVPSTPGQVPVTTSGRDIEWPQIGIGFGVGILLALALGMAMRLTGIRRLAH